MGDLVKLDLGYEEDVMQVVVELMRRNCDAKTNVNRKEE